MNSYDNIINIKNTDARDDLINENKKTKKKCINPTRWCIIHRGRDDSKCCNRKLASVNAGLIFWKLRRTWRNSGGIIKLQYSFWPVLCRNDNCNDNNNNIIKTIIIILMIIIITFYFFSHYYSPRCRHWNFWPSRKVQTERYLRKLKLYRRTYRYTNITNQWIVNRNHIIVRCVWYERMWTMVMFRIVKITF